MKKIFFAALAAVALTACVADVVTEEPTSAIDFVSNTKGTVKSTVVTEDNFGSFNVYAFNGENVIMNGLLVEEEGGNWTYSPKKYWPAVGNVDFYGVYADETDQVKFNYNATAAAGLKFNINMPTVKKEGTEFIYDEKSVVDAAAVPDVVYATAIGKNKNNLANANGLVEMTFHHAMAQVVFQIKNATTPANNIEVVAGDVYIKNLYCSGTYTAKENSWDFTDIGKNHYLFKTNGVRIFNTDESNGTTKAILAGDCMVLPQEETVEFGLNCTIKQKNDNNDGSVVIFHGEKTATVSVAWLEGFKYTYTFALYDTNLTDNEINFTAKVLPITPDPVTPPTEEDIQ